ncbi:ettA [Symbiodinium sp. KB8]|nr:ettA [Symbiodinium sp. KB8]
MYCWVAITSSSLCPSVEDAGPYWPVVRCLEGAGWQSPAPPASRTIVAADLRGSSAGTDHSANTDRCKIKSQEHLLARIDSPPDIPSNDAKPHCFFVHLLVYRPNHPTGNEISGRGVLPDVLATARTGKGSPAAPWCAAAARQALNQRWKAQAAFAALRAHACSLLELPIAGPSDPSDDQEDQCDIASNLGKTRVIAAEGVVVLGSPLGHPAFVQAWAEERATQTLALHGTLLPCLGPERACTASLCLAEAAHARPPRGGDCRLGAALVEHAVRGGAAGSRQYGSGRRWLQPLQPAAGEGPCAQGRLQLGAAAAPAQISQVTMPRDSEDSSDEEKPPTAEEVEEFLRHNKVDERAAQDLRECPPEVQKRVLTRGDLNSARNPSAAVLVRIRDARVEDKPQRGRTASRPMGLPSSSEVNGYIKANGVNEVAAQALRSCSPTVKRTVLSSGDVIGAFDPSAALLAKIKDVRAGGTGSINLASMGMMPSMPSATDIDAFVEYNDLDESAEAQLRACPPYVIALVLGKGDLRGTRNPSSVVLSRIREAKAAPPPPMPVHMPPPGVPFPGHVPPFGYPPHGPPGHPFAFPPHGAPPPFGPHGTAWLPAASHGATSRISACTTWLLWASGLSRIGGVPALAALGAAAGARAFARRGQRTQRQAKSKKSQKKGGKTSGIPIPKSDSAAPDAYDQETRDIILSMSNVDKKSLDGSYILKDVSLGMYMGAKIGILGKNGAGKSTVMRILAGEDDEFLGKLERDEAIQVGYLAQEPVLKEETVIANLEPAVDHIKAMVKEFEDVSMQMTDPDADVDALMQKMETIQSKIDACNGWEIDQKLDEAMAALNCPPRDAKIATLSGGELRRVAICRLLLSNPDILMLDEPTNHLDAQSVAWLERFLAEFQGTVVAITHDRYFLDNVAGWILELDQGKGIPFQGNYSGWLEHKAKRLESEQKRKATLESQMAKELEFINARRSGRQKKGKARQRRFEDLEQQASAFNRSSELDSIVITPGPRLANEPVITAKNLSKGYGDRLLINEASFEIPPGAVVGIIGPNGAGKTTLFKMIMGKEQPDGGELLIGETVAPMYVEQMRDDLDGDATVFEELTDGLDAIDIGGREVNSRAYCSWFNFRGKIQQRTVSSLSGGERNRLQLARTLRLGGNCLMLDEPSNDLDVETLRALETAIENFAGTVLCVSHDRWFLDRIATHIIAYEGDSQVVFFEGGYSDYEEDRFQRTGHEKRCPNFPLGGEQLALCSRCPAIPMPGFIDRNAFKVVPAASQISSLGQGMRSTQSLDETTVGTGEDWTFTSPIRRALHREFQSLEPVTGQEPLTTSVASSQSGSPPSEKKALLAYSQCLESRLRAMTGENRGMLDCQSWAQTMKNDICTCSEYRIPARRREAIRILADAEAADISDIPPANSQCIIEHQQTCQAPQMVEHVEDKPVVLDPLVFNVARACEARFAQLHSSIKKDTDFEFAAQQIATPEGENKAAQHADEGNGPATAAGLVNRLGETGQADGTAAVSRERCINAEHELAALRSGGLDLRDRQRAEEAERAVLEMKAALRRQHQVFTQERSEAQGVQRQSAALQASSEQAAFRVGGTIRQPSV